MSAEHGTGTAIRGLVAMLKACNIHTNFLKNCSRSGNGRRNTLPNQKFLNMQITLLIDLNFAEIFNSTLRSFRRPLMKIICHGIYKRMTRKGCEPPFVLWPLDVFPLPILRSLLVSIVFRETYTTQASGPTPGLA